MTDEHTVEPEAPIILGAGEYIGDDRARCAFCGLTISGNENGWYHWESGDPDMPTYYRA